MQFLPNKLERSVLDTERLSDLSKVTLPILGLKPQQSDPRARFETVACENGCTQQLLWEASPWPAGLADLFHVAPPHLQHGQVVVGLCKVVVAHQSQPEALVGQVHVPYPL